MNRPMQLFNQSRFAFLVLLCSAILLVLFSFLPLQKSLNQTASLYYPLLQPDTPIIRVYNDRLEFEGEIPKTVILDNGVTVFFDRQPNDSLLAASPLWSVFIAENVVKLKTRTRIRELAVKEIEIDKEPLVIDPLKIKQIIDRFSKLIKWGGSFFAAIVALFFVSAVALFSAAIGLMIDAFRNGINSLRFYFSLASVVQLVFLLFYFIRPSAIPIRMILLAYLIVYITAVYWLISRQIENS